MGVIISRMKEIRENRKIKKQERNTGEGNIVEQSRSINCLKMRRRDQRAEKIYEEIRPSEYDDISIEV